MCNSVEYPAWQGFRYSFPTLGKKQSKTLILINERRSNIVRNRDFDCHLSPDCRQMAIKTLCLEIFGSRSSIIESIFDCRLRGVFPKTSFSLEEREPKCLLAVMLMRRYLKIWPQQKTKRENHMRIVTKDGIMNLTFFDIFWDHDVELNVWFPKKMHADNPL